MFGGLEGLESSLDADPSLQVEDPSLLFDHYINVCPGQGSRTIRTEVSSNNICCLVSVQYIHNHKIDILLVFFSRRLFSLPWQPCSHTFQGHLSSYLHELLVSFCVKMTINTVLYSILSVCYQVFITKFCTNVSEIESKHQLLCNASYGFN